MKELDSLCEALARLWNQGLNSLKQEVYFTGLNINPCTGIRSISTSQNLRGLAFPSVAIRYPSMVKEFGSERTLGDLSIPTGIFRVRPAMLLSLACPHALLPHENKQRLGPPPRWETRAIGSLLSSSPCGLRRREKWLGVTPAGVGGTTSRIRNAVQPVYVPCLLRVYTFRAALLSPFQSTRTRPGSKEFFRPRIPP